MDAVLAENKLLEDTVVTNDEDTNDKITTDDDNSLALDVYPQKN